MIDYYSQGMRTARRMLDTFVCLAQAKHPSNRQRRLSQQRQGFYVLWALEKLNQWAYGKLHNPHLHPSWKLGVLAELAHHNDCRRFAKREAP